MLRKLIGYFLTINSLEIYSRIYLYTLEIV